jgi:hypothetical protein
MKSKSRPTPCLLLALLLAVSACGSTVDTGYPGEPLVTLEGQMALAPGVTVNGPVRLALVWYPRFLFSLDLGFFLPEADSRAVVAEDIPYEGTFPANFRFHVYGPPPAGARMESTDGTRIGLSSGILLAYQDGNGNGKLDTIPATGSPVDRILGSSVVFTESQFHYLIYSGVELDLIPGVQLKKGFNLVRIAGLASETLPLTTPISLELSGNPILEMLVCEPLWESADPPRVEGDLCGIPGLDGFKPAPDSLQVAVTVERTGDQTQARLDITTGEAGAGVKDAEVTLGGRPVPYDPDTESYALLETETSPLSEGGPIELFIRSGGKEHRRTLTIPGRFDITTPVADSVVGSGSKLEVRWTRPEGAGAYNLYLFAGLDTRTAVLLPPDQLAYSFYSVSHVGPALFRVEAAAGQSGNNPDLQVLVRVIRDVSFTLGE